MMLEDTSEAEFILSKFGQMGYWCSYQVIEARDYGSYAGRERCYFVASRVGSVGQNACGAAFRSLLLAFRTDAGALHQ